MATALFKLATENYLRKGCRVKDNHIFHSLLHTVRMTNCWFHFFTYCWHIFGANKHAEELLAAPPRCTGQTGTGHRSDRCRREDPTRNQRTSPGQDPVEARSRRGSARRVVLGSAGQLGRLQTSRRWRKNSMVGVEKVRERGRKVNTIKDKFDRFDCDISLNRPWPLFL
jgi:hypothetical protein